MLLDWYSSMKKKISKDSIQMVLDIENSLWMSDFDTFWWPVSKWMDSKNLVI